MKKFVAVLLAAVLCLSFAACGGEKATDKTVDAAAMFKTLLTDVTYTDNAAAAVKKLIQTYIDDSIDAKYNVDEVALLQNAKIHSMGNYVAVAVTSDIDNVNKVIDQYFA